MNGVNKILEQIMVLALKHNITIIAVINMGNQMAASEIRE